MTRILKGKQVADAINQKSIASNERLRQNNITPTLAIFRVGENEADISYEKSAIKKCKEIGVEVIINTFDLNVSEKEFYKKLDEANNDNSIHGILVFRPLPKQFNDNHLRNYINPDKDIDGCSNDSLAGIFINQRIGCVPCTSQSAIEILDYYGIDIQGKNVVVIGRSLVIGKPVSMLLLNRNATVTICHSKTKDIANIASKADILITAIGKSEMIDRSYTNEKQTIIDIGISWNEKKQKICGDVNYDDVVDYVDAITPVPGGVGAVTSAVLANHVIQAALRINNIQD